jgi:hypothetical protein
MDKDEWKSFFRFLDQASMKELSARHELLSPLLKTVNNSEVRSDLKRSLRLLEMEMLIRQSQASRRRALRWPLERAVSGGNRMRAGRTWPLAADPARAPRARLAQLETEHCLSESSRGHPSAVR